MPNAGADESAPDAYGALLDRYRRIANVDDVADLLSWDQQVVMPESGTPARSAQRSALSAVHHDLLADSAVGGHLDTLADADLTGRQAAVVREIRRDHERARRVPTELVETLAATASDALSDWAAAREAAEFDAFAPALEDLVALRRREAEHVAPDRDPYAVLFEEYEPCLLLDRAEAVLAEVREAVVALLGDVRASDVTPARPFEGQFDVDGQAALVRETLDSLGFPWDRGRLDTSDHPFSTGTPFDARVTTRYDEAAPLDALFSAIHEFGHAAYVLGLPRAEHGTPLGEDRDLTIHESQSRLWENHVGRSRAFWEWFLPRLVDRFPSVAGTTPAEAHQAANRVRESNPIRVEADELSYHLHVVLRFEIERDLVRGDLDVAEVPAVWDDRMERYLGVRPADDAEGCLQDVHWSHGAFGYFPTYTLGSVAAAQLYEAAEREIEGLADHVRGGEFDPLREWLRDAVHRHGRRYETDDLLERATGEPLTAGPFVDHVRERYRSLYDLPA